MPFSAGVYTLPTPALVPGQTVASTENNTSRNDFATALNLTFLRNGTSTATANLPMGGFKLTGLGVATTSGDALSYGQAAVVSNLTDTALTITRVPYVSTGGLLVDNSGFTFDGTTLTAGGFSTSGNIAAATASISGNITVSGGTANGVAYLNGSKVLTSGSALTFDGSLMDIGVGAQYGTLSLKRYSGAPYATLTLTDPSNAANEVGIYLRSTGTNPVGISAAGAPIAFYLGGAGTSEQMRLTSTGLGIGTSSPDTKLDVRGEISVAYNATYGIRFYNQDRNNWSSIGNNTATGNTGANLVFKSGTGTMTFDNAGNLGLGVTPSAYTGLVAAQVGAGSIVSSKNTNNALFSSNWYSDGTDRYLLSGYLATQYQQYAGQHRWYTAPSGTAGNAISFTQAMTLDASGYLSLTSPAPRYTISPSTTTNNALMQFSNGGGTGFVGLDSSTGSGLGAAYGLFLYHTGSYPIVFANANTERMRIDSSGNVGIGTSSPASKLNVSGTFTITGAGQQMDNGQGINMKNASGTYRQAIVLDGSNNLVLGGTVDGGILFNTSLGNERMRIDSSGNLLVGTTTAVTTNVAGVMMNVVSTQGRITIGCTSTAAQDLMYFFNPNGIVGKVQTSGSSTSYVTSSDYRLKENIQPMQGALATIQQLNPVTYTWKADGSDGQGFIAHELQAVVPDCVTGEKDAVDEEGKPVYQGIDTSFLVGILTKAIQELKSELDATKAEVAALKQGA